MSTEAPAMGRGEIRRWAVISIVFAIALYGLFLALRISAGPATGTAPSEELRAAECRTRTIGTLSPKPETIDVLLLNQISVLCYNQIRGEDALGDYNIRRSKFLWQTTESMIMLWMVVLITLSGVVLAALQIWAAYQLAASGRADIDKGLGGELILEQGKLSLKSSVTGLLILTVSFAFFLVDVIYVHTLKETRIETDDAPPNHLQNRLGNGGLGVAPQVSQRGAKADRSGSRAGESK